MATVEVKTSFFKDTLAAAMQAEGDKIMEAFKRGRPTTPAWHAGSLANRDTGALKRSSPNRWRDPIILHSGTSSIGELRQEHHAFICEYCGRASQSVEPCQGCGAVRTGGQIEGWRGRGE